MIKYTCIRPLVNQKNRKYKPEVNETRYLQGMNENRWKDGRNGTSVGRITILIVLILRTMVIFHICRNK